MAGNWFYEAIFLKISSGLYPRATLKKIFGFHEWLLEALGQRVFYVTFKSWQVSVCQIFVKICILTIFIREGRKSMAPAKHEKGKAAFSSLSYPVVRALAQN